MAIALVAVVTRRARALHATLRPHPGRVLRAAATGVPLLVRTVALRAVFVVTTWVAAGLGDVPVAAYQVSVTVWSFLAFALDALAIAGQALTGKALGAGDVASARSATRTMTWWGVLGGAVLGAVVLALHQVLPPLFTSDPAVQQALAAGLVVVAVSQPLSGLVFVLDGVLIGAGDGRWLAGAQVAVLLAYLAAGAVGAQPRRPRCWPGRTPPRRRPTPSRRSGGRWWRSWRCAAWRWVGAPGATPGS